jgi:hypothetical protein
MNTRILLTSVVLLTLAALGACAAQLPLIWDGGYQLAATLVEQRPYFYLTRFHSWVLWWPTVWLSRVTDNSTALIFAYGLPFLLAPAVSVGAGWWFVRATRPALAVWTVLGCMASLPGQVFVINDSIWQQTLAWPLVLGALVPLRWPQRVAWLAFGAAQFPHQIGVLTLGAALVAAYVAGERWQRGMLAGLLVLAVVKVTWISVPAWSGALHDTYAAQEANWERVWLSFRTGVLWLPLMGLGVLWLAAALIAFGKARALPWLALVLAGLWLWWVAWPGLWLSAINYRRFVVPLAGPLFLAATIHAGRLRRSAPEKNEAALGRGALIFTSTFAAVLSVQSLVWASLWHRLCTEAARAPKVQLARADFPWMRETVLDHWGLTPSVLVGQGRVPVRHFAWDEATRLAPGAVPIAPGHVLPPETKWFDFRPLLARLPEGDAAR